MPHRETFTVSVNYDDPRWAEIRRDAYRHVDSDLKLSHFPIGGHGVSDVVVEYVVFDHEPTTQEALDEIKRRGLRCPDRAESESFLDRYSGEQKKYKVIGLVGSVMKRNDEQYVAYVRAYENGRNLYFDRLDYRWFQRCRFLAVRPAVSL